LSFDIDLSKNKNSSFVDFKNTYPEFEKIEIFKNTLILLYHIKKDLIKFNNFIKCSKTNCKCDPQEYYLLKNTLLKNLSKCNRLHIQKYSTKNNLINMNIHNYISNYANNLSMVIDKFDIIEKEIFRYN